MTSDFDKAYVIHTRPFQDNHLLVYLFTENQGYLKAIARGARAEKSKRRGLLQLFTPLLISLKGRGELLSLTEVEAASYLIMLKPQHLFCGLYLNELLVRTLPLADAHPTLFSIYEKTLLAMANATEVDSFLRIFEKRLLQEMGYALDLKQSADKMAIDPDVHYCYLPDRGFFPSKHHISADIPIFQGKILLALAKEQWEDTDTLQGTKKLMRWVLQHSILHKAIQSRELFVKKIEETPL